MTLVDTTVITAPPLGPMQSSLFGGAAPSVVPLSGLIQRVQLDPCCWVDVAQQWFTGADQLLVDLLDRLDWSQGRRLMYGTFHDEPRLSARANLNHPVFAPLVHKLVAQLVDHYDRDFTNVFCNYYRDGADSVAWHADRVGRHQVDPLVAIICLGGPRPFRLRPMGGGSSISLNPGSGDLIVMGGATQHHWEHAVPKVATAPPRLSVTIRSGPGSDQEWR